MQGGVPGNMIAGPAPGMMPVMSQSDTAATGTSQTMWAGGQQQQQPPPHTPPQHGTQPNTPAPSPGLPQMYNGPPHHQPPSYPPGPGQQGPNFIVLGPGHAGGLPQHIPTSVAPHHPPHLAHGAPGHMMGPGPGQTTTSMSGMMPQYHFIPQHQGSDNVNNHHFIN